MQVISIFKREGVLPVTIAVIVSMFVVVLSASATTTISTSIATGGDLYASSTANVTGLSVLTGGFISQASSTITGQTNLQQASTTLFTASGLATLASGFVSQASSTVAAALTVTGQTSLGQASTTLFTSSGQATFGTGGFVSQASSTVVGAFTVTGAATFNGAVANNSTLTQGSGGTAITSIIFGVCSIPATALVASTTTQVVCSGATGVTSSSKVFVQATSSIPEMIIVQSATSSTDAINVRLFDTGIGTTTNGGIGASSLQFWAVR